MEDFAKIDSYIEDTTKNADTKKDKLFRRFFITWNNPFWENQFEEVDINNTDLPLNLEKYDYTYFKEEDAIECFDFKYIKYFNKKKNEYEIVERAFFKDDTAIQNYFATLTNMKYYVFQIEKGGNSELTHIQGLITFSKPQHWSTFCRKFPLADFSDVYSSNTCARAYCTKEDTRIRGPYEYGNFAEERARTDIKEFLELLDVGASDYDLKTTHPSLYLREFNKISALRTQNKFNEFRNKKRNVETTFIYGPEGVGKSSYVYDLLGFENTFSVQTFDNSAFTYYEGQDYLVIDEFNAQWSIQFMNKLLDNFPLQLRGLGCIKWACYQKVYIISNYGLKDLYKDKQENEPTIYKSFLRRIDNVIRFDSFGKYHFEKQKNTPQQIEMIEIKEELEF